MMLTHRASISAVCGYSSLSIMFLSAVSAIRRAATEGIQVVTNVARFSRAWPSSSSSLEISSYAVSLSRPLSPISWIGSVAAACSMSLVASGKVWLGRCLASGIEAP